MPRHDIPDAGDQQNWQPGDLALCIFGGKIKDSDPDTHGYPQAGHIYSVEKTCVEEYATGHILPSLVLRDGPQNRGGMRVWPARRFRKINPLTDDERMEGRHLVPLRIGFTYPMKEIADVRK